ncbi:MAG: PD-(D/E)XK nuclease family protein [Candidatus Pacebacteria bacterium]|jgi:hypothetical protein|nr:PD-(D/E)XK nuclease family protein [Candidatus Paceibacterota bacterium]
MNKQALEKEYKEFISDRDVSRLELLLNKPNIFNALKVGHYEIRHSNFLAWLLDPNESHGLGDLFLKRFLRETLISPKVNVSLIDIEEMNTDLTNVKREFLNFDILIELKEIIVVIENKIHSSEGNNQLKRYYDTAHTEFSGKPLAFVYLTLEGDIPSNEEYIPFSYEQIESILNELTTVFGESLNPSIKVYLNDYLHLIKNSIMKNGEIDELSRKIYRNHKTLLDTLFSYRQDSITYLRTFFDNQVKNSGWELTSQSRGFIRFITPELDSILPRNGNGWIGKESFLFEINYAHKRSSKLSFYCTVPPGDEETRKVLEKIFQEIIPGNDQQNNKWKVYFYSEKPFMVDEWALKNSDEIESFISELWEEVEDTVKKVQAGLLKYKNELLKLKNRE